MIEVAAVFEQDRRLIASKALLDDPDRVACLMGLPSKCKLFSESLARDVYSHWGVLRTEIGEAFLLTDRVFPQIDGSFCHIPSKVVDYHRTKTHKVVRVVDLGGGRFCEAARGLAERSGTMVTSVDITARTFSLKNLRSVQADVCDTTLESMSADLVYSSQVLPFFKDAPDFARRRRALEEVIRILDCGGIGVIDICNLEPGQKAIPDNLKETVYGLTQRLDVDILLREKPTINSLVSGKVVYARIFKKPIDVDMVKACGGF